MAVRETWVFGSLDECVSAPWRAGKDTIVFNAAITSCGKGSQWQHSLALLERLGCRELVQEPGHSSEPLI